MIAQALNSHINDNKYKDVDYHPPPVRLVFHVKYEDPVAQWIFTVEVRGRIRGVVQRPTAAALPTRETYDPWCH